MRPRRGLHWHPSPSGAVPEQPNEGSETTCAPMAFGSSAPRASRAIGTSEPVATGQTFSGRFWRRAISRSRPAVRLARPRRIVALCLRRDLREGEGPRPRRLTSRMVGPSVSPPPDASMASQGRKTRRFGTSQRGDVFDRLVGRPSSPTPIESCGDVDHARPISAREAGWRAGIVGEHQEGRGIGMTPPCSAMPFIAAAMPCLRMP